MNENSFRRWCEAQNLKPSVIARRYHIPLKTVQKWYNGESNIKEYVFRMIQKIEEIGQ